VKSLVFLPVFNEIRAFPTVLAELRAAPLPVDTVLLVNNGSSDGCETLVRESGHPYLDLPENRGIGYSFIRAVLWAMERGYDVFSVMASNGKMLPAELGRVVGPVLRGEMDLVTGSRFLEGGDSPNLPQFRKNSIPMVNHFVRAITGAKLSDATCGYRAWRLDLMERADFDWRAAWLETYGFEYYLYAKVILDRGLRWCEVPVTMRYPPKGQPYSKIPPVVGWYHMLRPWVRARVDGRGFRRA